MLDRPAGPWLHWLNRQKVYAHLSRWDRRRFADMAPQFCGEYRAPIQGFRLRARHGVASLVWVEEN